MTNDRPRPLAREALANRCDPASLGFETTAELDGPGGIVGQERAAQALAFGVGVAHEGYNVFVMGAAGSGRRTLVQGALGERARAAVTPSDWVYVNNFAAPYQPVAIELPPGRGAALKRDMEHLLEELRAAIPAVFESEEYAHRVEQIDTEFTERHEREVAALGQDASHEGIALLRTPAGFTFAPLKNGEVISAEDFNQLPEAERQRVTETISGLQQRLEKLVRMTLRWRKERNERVRHLNHDMILLSVGQLVEEITERYGEFPKVVEYLGAVRTDVLENANDFRRPEGAPGMPGLGAQAAERELRRYAVNLLVDRSGATGAEVVFADYPTYANLMGRVEHLQHLGTLVTDFTLVKPGALHRANGGYLVLDALKVLTQPFAWEALKRTLTRREIRIESLGELWGIASTVSLEPEPIPLAVKVVLLGERNLYYLLQALDPDFRRLFEVVADFEEAFDRTTETSGAFARMIAGLARHDGLLPLERGAVARAIDYAARRAGDAHKLSADIGSLARVLREADFLARQAKRAVVTAADLESAMAGQRARSDRLRRRVHEAILRGTLLIDTAGARVGQVNGLSVVELGEFPFAEPTRITATTRVGDGRVIDIQREVELGERSTPRA